MQPRGAGQSLNEGPSTAPLIRGEAAHSDCCRQLNEAPSTVPLIRGEAAHSSCGETEEGITRFQLTANLQRFQEDAEPFSGLTPTVTALPIAGTS